MLSRVLLEEAQEQLMRASLALAHLGDFADEQEMVTIKDAMMIVSEAARLLTELARGKS